MGHKVKKQENNVHLYTDPCSIFQDINGLNWSDSHYGLIII